MSAGEGGQEQRKTPEPSGVDLARQALAAAREQARARGNAVSGRKRQQQPGPGPAPARTAGTRCR